MRSLRDRNRILKQYWGSDADWDSLDLSGMPSNTFYQRKPLPIAGPAPPPPPPKRPLVPYAPPPPTNASALVPTTPQMHELPVEERKRLTREISIRQRAIEDAKKEWEPEKYIRFDAESDAQIDDDIRRRKIGLIESYRDDVKQLANGAAQTAKDSAEVLFNKTGEVAGPLINSAALALAVTTGGPAAGAAAGLGLGAQSLYKDSKAGLKSAYDALTNGGSTFPQPFGKDFLKIPEFPALPKLDLSGMNLGGVNTAAAQVGNAVVILVVIAGSYVVYRIIAR